MTRDELFNRLIAILGRENIRAANNDYEFWARCPCHGDRQPSLHLTFTAERLLVYCFAGCRTERILAALGLTFADLFYGADKRSRRVPRNWPIAGYDYTDEGGNLVFQTLKYPDPERGKTFRQRRPGSDGEWIWNLEGVPRVLYRLPEVLAAVREGRPLFIVEGEKDTDNLAALGLTATTNPNGAGKWRPEYGEFLRGARVVIIPDNDDAGHDHAQQVAQALSGVAAEVKILELPGLPPKGDVSDWLAGGGTKEELLRLAEEAPRWEPEEVPDPRTLAGLDDEEKPTQAQLLIKLAADAELFHTPNMDCFATIAVGEHVETWPVKAKGFRRWLVYRFYKAEGRPPGAQALQDALV